MQPYAAGAAGLGNHIPKALCGLMQPERSGARVELVQQSVEIRREVYGSESFVCGCDIETRQELFSLAM